MTTTMNAEPQQQDRQIAAITAIRYKLRWGRTRMFCFILETVPEVRERLNNHEIKYASTTALYKVMDTAQKSKVISRLDMVQDRIKRIQKQYSTALIESSNGNKKK